MSNEKISKIKASLGPYIAMNSIASCGPYYGIFRYLIRQQEKWNKCRSVRPDLTNEELQDMFRQYPGNIDEFYMRLMRG